MKSEEVEDLYEKLLRPPGGAFWHELDSADIARIKRFARRCEEIGADKLLDTQDESGQPSMTEFLNRVGAEL